MNDLGMELFVGIFGTLFIVGTIYGIAYAAAMGVAHALNKHLRITTNTVVRHVSEEQFAAMTKGEL